MSKKILIVEDSPSALALLKIALEQAAFDLPTFHVSNGEEALEYLHAQAEKNDLPAFILMDINKPIMNGKEALKAIKQNPALQSIPIAMLTVSTSPKDIEECYKLGANSFICKTADFDDYTRKIALLKEFWFDAAELPSQADDVAIVREQLMPNASSTAA